MTEYVTGSYYNFNFEEIEMPYGWIITKDKVSEGADEGVAGPRGLEDKVFLRLKAGEGLKWRMRDDDGEVYYEGRYIGDTSEDLFAPLDDFGMPNAGCTDIEYFENGKWEYI